MRAAPRTLFGSDYHDRTRDWRSIIIVLQSTMDSEIMKEFEGRCLLLGGRYDGQDPHPVGNGQAPRPRKRVLILRRFAERSIPR